MTQPQTMTVDQQEILKRATEVEAPMKPPPTDVPAAPSALTAAKNAAQQIVLNADNMRDYLAGGAKERSRLATSLRNAAKAYGDVEEEAATDLNNDGQGSVEAEGVAGADGDGSAGLQETQSVAAAGDPDFTDLKTAATKLESGDQGRSLADFAEGWTALNFALQGDVKRFRAFENWTGDAATACEASLDQQRIWILHMAKLSASVAEQGQYMAQLQLWARRSHPTLEDIAKLEEYAQDPNYKTEAIKLYKEYQAKSEQVLSEYNSKAATIKPLEIPKPQPAVKIDPPPPPQTPGLIPGFLMPPSDGSSGGTPSTGMPQAPMMPPGGGAGGGMPSGAAELTGAMRDAAAKLPGDLSMKPMSLGGGGGGGGGAMPAMPMAPATGIDGESMRPQSAGDIGGAGQGKGAAGGGMAGGGGGMPMGGAHGAQGGSKSKGSQQDDEALYTEDRAWTEAVIGNRRRADSKESK